ncbi:FtsW/RodA/SpoVE family cell cycle protein, partial [uncultured Deinococcus sp.]
MSVQLLVAQLLLITLGLIGVAAARPQLIVEHGSKAIIAIIATFLVARLKPRTFLKAGTVFWGVTLVLLMLVLVIGVGTETSPGTRRWLNLGIRFQPSELAKLGLILQLASFFSRRGVQHKLLSATGMIVFTTLLVILEPDLGTSVLTFGLGIILMYAAGVRISNISGFLLSLGLVSIPFISLYLERHPYILERWFG